MGMLSVLKIRNIQSCDGIYDSIGDKVLVDYKSPLAMEITQQIDVRKKLITERITKEVFESPEAKYLTKTELNKRIRNELRDAFF